uniref:TonB-dependent receptor n=1 Tax=Dechloromonas aromatica (strain RCB) TaxID=159087 RepID=Q478H5_DECAR
MKIHLRPITLGLITAFSQPLSAFAQQALEPVVVTATRGPLLLEHATGETVVIGRQEIEARQTDRLTDIVNNTAGVFVSTGKGPLQTTPGFALRGIPSDRRALVLLDGIPMTDGYAGSVLLGGIPTESIQQTEILFGPMSSLYGGNAMGGVVNFVTRMPTRTEFGFNVGYGDAFETGKAPADVQKAYLHAGTRLENGLAIRFTGNWAQTNGYRSEWVTGSRPTGSRGAIPTSTELGAGTYLLGQKGDNTWQEHGASLKLEQRVSTDTSWRAGWLLQDYHYGYAAPESFVRSNATGAPIYNVSFAGGDSNYTRQLFHAGFDTKLGIGQLNVLASHTAVTTNSYIIATTGSTAFGGPGRISDSPSESTAFDTYWNASLGAHDLTVGYAYRQDSADAKDYTLSNWGNPESKTALYSTASGKMYLHGAYLQDNWQLAPSLTVQGGLRYDHWLNANGQSSDPTGSYSYAERTAAAWSPKLGASWRVTDAFTLRTSAGKAFHAPTVYDLYRSSFSSYLISANPALTPETVKSWEVGSDWRAWNGGEIRATYFHNEIDDLIYLGPKQTGPGNIVVRKRINAGKARTNGVTLSATHHFDADNRVFANLTYTHSEMLENSASPSSVGKRLTGLPEKQASIGFETRRGDWLLSTSGRYASKQYADDTNADTAAAVYKAYDAYFVVDSKLSYRFNKSLNASLAVSNLFDRNYFSYYAAPGRAWFASLAYSY